MRTITLCHKQLQVVPWYQFVMHSGPREMNIVAAQAHQLVLVGHAIGRK